jgi:uncharacterized protein
LALTGVTQEKVETQERASSFLLLHLRGRLTMKLKNRKSLEHKEEMAIEVVARTLKSQFPVEEIILFGSKARGDYDAFSDIDLLLITTKRLHWKEEKAIVEVLFEIGMTHDVIFTPLFVSNEEWKGGLFTQFPIYSEILRDGAVIP